MKSLTPVTKQDIDSAVDELAQITNKNFRRIERDLGSIKNDLGSVKKDLGNVKKDLVSVKEDLGSVKSDLRSVKDNLETIEDRVANRVVATMKAYFELVISELKGAHDDEMAIVEGKQDAPGTWKSIPRRLKTVETEVEKIKDKI